MVTKDRDVIFKPTTPTMPFFVLAICNTAMGGYVGVHHNYEFWFVLFCLCFFVCVA